MTSNELHHAKKTKKKVFRRVDMYLSFYLNPPSLCTNESLRNNSNATSFKILIDLKTWETTDVTTN